MVTEKCRSMGANHRFCWLVIGCLLATCPSPSGSPRCPTSRLLCSMASPWQTCRLFPDGRVELMAFFHLVLPHTVPLAADRVRCHRWSSQTAAQLVQGSVPWATLLHRLRSRFLVGSPSTNWVPEWTIKEISTTIVNTLALIGRSVWPVDIFESLFCSCLRGNLSSLALISVRLLRVCSDTFRVAIQT